MKFAVCLQPQIESEKVPVLYWLSGLTCTEQNFITKAGQQRVASTLGLALVAPDTSPLGGAISSALKRLKAANIDQEVKERAITCM